MAASERSTIILEGILFYPIVQKPLTNKFGKTEYKVSIGLSQDTIDELDEAGVIGMRKAKKLDPANPGLKFITFSRQANLYNGAPNTPVTVVDKNNNIITDLIGNGSKGKIMLDINRTQNKAGMDVVYVDLSAVQILELVKFTSGKEETAAPKARTFPTVTDEDGDTDFSTSANF